MIVVSGCPRSGTSLMMLLHREALGEDAIVGSKWMGIDPEYKNEHMKKCAEYIKDKNDPDWRQEQEETKNMNPNGFWECNWTIRGLQWAQKPPEPNKVCKIVSQGLARTNPQYVDKLVMMVRHPWSVANSHKDLKLSFPFARNVRNKDIDNINPRMYIRSTIDASRWILKNNPQLLMVDYDQLVLDTENVIESISDFIGEGDWGKAKDVVDKRYKRNLPERFDDSESWDTALDIHRLFKTRQFEGVVDIGDSLREKAKEEPNVGFFCPRWGGQVGSNFCKQCKKGDRDYLYNLKVAASKRGIDWSEEPCLWDCGMNPSEEYTPVTIEQSIEENHWLKI